MKVGTKALLGPRLLLLVAGAIALGGCSSGTEFFSPLEGYIGECSLSDKENTFVSSFEFPEEIEKLGRTIKDYDDPQLFLYIANEEGDVPNCFFDCGFGLAVPLASPDDHLSYEVSIPHIATYLDFLMETAIDDGVGADELTCACFSLLFALPSDDPGDSDGFNVLFYLGFSELGYVYEG